MERLTRRSDTGHAYYPRCFEGPCNGNGCKFKDCPFDETICKRLAAYEDTELEPAMCANYKAFEDEAISKGVTFKRIIALMEADRTGRLVVLPCKVGDTVWVTRNPWTGKLLKKPLDAYVNGMKMYSHGLYVNLLFDTREINGTRDYEINHIGKTVFLIREEAEKALEAMKK